MMFLLYILLLIAYLYFARRSVDRAIPTKEMRAKQIEHLNRLRSERMVDDFVLTAAVIPALDNDIRPQEGFRVYQNYGHFKINGGCLIIASVSAEKMRPLVLALVRCLGSIVSISFEDYYSDAKNVIDYLSFDRDIFVIESVINRYWRLIQDSYDVQMSAFSPHVRAEVVLPQVKLVHIHAAEPAPFLEVLAEYGLQEKPEMRFFIEGPYYAYDDYAGSDLFSRLISELEVHEKRFYEKQGMMR
ncbi:hypothetical protein JW998_10695 [candidate division KSB1 bacterium]|nr:hypothetical protein [candidate division KSB1 bacterium]